MALITQKFDIGSPGFLYSVIVFVLTLLSTIGVTFPKEVEVLGLELVTSLSTGGIYAIIGVLISSVAFPLYNAIKADGIFWTNLKTSTLTWVALGNAVMALLALAHFVLPAGTVEQIAGAVKAQDWMSLVGIIAMTVGNTFLRWLKDRNKPPVVVVPTSGGR